MARTAAEAAPGCLKYTALDGSEGGRLRGGGVDETDVVDGAEGSEETYDGVLVETVGESLEEDAGGGGFEWLIGLGGLVGAELLVVGVVGVEGLSGGLVHGLLIGELVHGLLIGELVYWLIELVHWLIELVHRLLIGELVYWLIELVHWLIELVHRLLISELVHWLNELVHGLAELIHGLVHGLIRELVHRLTGELIQGLTHRLVGELAHSLPHLRIAKRTCLSTHPLTPHSPHCLLTLLSSTIHSSFHTSLHSSLPSHHLSPRHSSALPALLHKLSSLSAPRTPSIGLSRLRRDVTTLPSPRILLHRLPRSLSPREAVVGPRQTSQLHPRQRGVSLLRLLRLRLHRVLALQQAPPRNLVLLLREKHVVARGKTAAQQTQSRRVELPVVAHLLHAPNRRHREEEALDHLAVPRVGQSVNPTVVR